MWGLKKGKYQIVHDLKYILGLKSFLERMLGSLIQRFDKYQDNLTNENEESLNNNSVNKCPFYNSKKGAKVPCGLKCKRKKRICPFWRRI